MMIQKFTITCSFLHQYRYLTIGSDGQNGGRSCYMRYNVWNEAVERSCMFHKTSFCTRLFPILTFTNRISLKFYPKQLSLLVMHLTSTPLYLAGSTEPQSLAGIIPGSVQKVIMKNKSVSANAKIIPIVNPSMT